MKIEAVSAPARHDSNNLSNKSKSTAAKGKSRRAASETGLQVWDGTYHPPVKNNKLDYEGAGSAMIFGAVMQTVSDNKLNRADAND